jgi:hypothetical protein
MSETPPQRRSRGLGWVYRRGHIWWIQYSVRGKVYRETSGSTKQADATKLLKKRLGAAGLGKPVGPDLERTTFEDLARMLTSDYRVNNRKSLETAQGSVKALRGFFGFDRARDITYDRLTDYINLRLEAGRAPATIRN